MKKITLILLILALILCTFACAETVPAKEPESEPLTAEPIDDPKADPYIGTWNIEFIIKEDRKCNPESEGFAGYSITLNRDGTALLGQDGEAANTVWRMKNGSAFISMDFRTYSAMEIDEDDHLSIAQSDGCLVFTRAAEPGSCYQD